MSKTDGSVAETIPDSICEDAGVEKPQTETACDNTPCPRWFTSDWPECEESKCISRKTGVKHERAAICPLKSSPFLNTSDVSFSGILHREVVCGSSEDQPIDQRFCEAVLKPRASKTCRNKQCKGRWRAGNWSEVRQKSFEVYFVVDSSST